MRIILFLLLVTIAGGVPAQEPEYTVGSYFEPGVQFGNGRIYAGRNPAQPSDLVEFLREARIQQAIELTKEQEAAFQSLYSQIHRRGAVLAGDQVDVAKSGSIVCSVRRQRLSTWMRYLRRSKRSAGSACAPDRDT